MKLLDRVRKFNHIRHNLKYNIYCGGIGLGNDRVMGYGGRDKWGVNRFWLADCDATFTRKNITTIPQRQALKLIWSISI